MKTAKLALILAGVALFLVLVSRLSEVTTKRSIAQALGTQGNSMMPARMPAQPGYPAQMPMPDGTGSAAQMPPSPRQAELEARIEERMKELEDKVGAATAESVAKDAELSKLQVELDMMEEERRMMVDKMETEKALEKQKQEMSMSDSERRIQRAQSIASVTFFDKEFGFVAIDAGKSQGLTTGTRLAIRRDNVVVAELNVDTVELNSAIAGVKRSDAEPQPGDAVIAWPFGQ